MLLTALRCSIPQHEYSTFLHTCQARFKSGQFAVKPHHHKHYSNQRAEKTSTKIARVTFSLQKCHKTKKNDRQSAVVPGFTYRRRATELRRRDLVQGGSNIAKNSVCVKPSIPPRQFFFVDRFYLRPLCGESSSIIKSAPGKTTLFFSFVNAIIHFPPRTRLWRKGSQNIQLVPRGSLYCLGWSGFPITEHSLYDKRNNQQRRNLCTMV